MRAQFLFNPDAGRHPARRRRQFDQLRAGLIRAGWTLDSPTPDVLVVCGGDGTLHRAINQPLPAPMLAPVLAIAPPWGTANILAHALGVPSDPERAAAWLAAAHPRPLPLGLAATSSGTQKFIAVASAGFDAAIVHALAESTAKRRWGKLAFAHQAFRLRREVPPTTIVSLTRFYAGRLHFGTPGALSLPASCPRLLLPALFLLFSSLDRAPGVRRLPPGPVIVSTPGLPVQLDGEPAGFSPVVLRPARAPILFLSVPLAYVVDK